MKRMLVKLLTIAFAVALSCLSMKSYAQEIIDAAFVKNQYKEKHAFLEWNCENNLLEGKSENVFVKQVTTNEFIVLSLSNYLFIESVNNASIIKGDLYKGNIRFYNREVNKCDEEAKDKLLGQPLSTISLPRRLSFDNEFIECTIRYSDVDYTLKVYHFKRDKREPLNISLDYQDGGNVNSYTLSPKQTEGKDFLTDTFEFGDEFEPRCIRFQKPNIPNTFWINNVSIDDEPLIKKDDFSWGFSNPQLPNTDKHKITIEVAYLDVGDEEKVLVKEEKVHLMLKSRSVPKLTIWDKFGKLTIWDKFGLVLSVLNIIFSVSLVFVLFVSPFLMNRKSRKEKDELSKGINNEDDVSSDASVALKIIYRILSTEFGEQQSGERFSEHVQRSINELKKKGQIADKLAASKLESPTEIDALLVFFNKLADERKEIPDYGSFSRLLTETVFSDIVTPIPDNRESFEEFLKNYAEKVRQGKEELGSLKGSIDSLLGNPSGEEGVVPRLERTVRSLQAIPNTLEKYFCLSQGESYDDQFFNNLKEQIESLHRLEHFIEAEFGRPSEGETYPSLLKAKVKELNLAIENAAKTKKKALDTQRNTLNRSHNQKIENLESQLKDTNEIISFDFNFFVKRQKALIREIRTTYDSCSRYVTLVNPFGNEVKSIEKELQSFIDWFEKQFQSEGLNNLRLFLEQSKSKMIDSLSYRLSWLNTIIRLNAYSEHETLRLQLYETGVDLPALHRLHLCVVELASYCGITILPSPSLFFETSDIDEYKNDNKDLVISRLYPEYEDLVKRSAIIDIIQTGFTPDAEETIPTTIYFLSKPQA